MLKSTTSAKKALENPSNEEVAASDYYEDACGLPANMTTTLPSMGFMQWLFDGWLGKVFGKVLVDYVEQEGKHYYRLTLKVLLRKHSFVLVPLSAYMHANAIGTLQRMGLIDHMVVEGERTGSVYIPVWSRRKVYEECKKIAQTHEAEVKGHLSMISTLQQTHDEEGEHAEGEVTPRVTH